MGMENKKNRTKKRQLKNMQKEIFMQRTFEEKYSFDINASFVQFEQTMLKPK